MRFALKIYYDGRDFYGSQYQPEKRTVEGMLRKALLRLRINFKRICFAGRTDRLVSALGNVCCIDIDKKSAKRMAPKILNAVLPSDIRVLGVKKVKSDFNPRFAEERVYKYFLKDGKYSIRKMKKAAKLFEGERDFSNFSAIEKSGKKAKAKNPVRKISRIEIEEKNGFLIITFYAQSFLRQMVRRIVAALIMAGRGEISQKELKNYFEKDAESRAKKLFLPAKAENLVLWDVKYDFDFKHEKYSMLKLLEKIREEKSGFAKGAFMKDEMLSCFSQEARHRSRAS